MPRLLALIAAAALAVLAQACGGEEEKLLTEDSLKQCLAGNELTIKPPELSANAGLGNVSPDFSAETSDGVPVDVIVQGNERKATRTAADIQGALQSLGAVDSEVVAERNGIVVFQGAPSQDSRSAVEDCLAA